LNESSWSAPIAVPHNSDYLRDGFITSSKALSAIEAERYLIVSNRLVDHLGGCPAAIRLTQLHRHFGWADELTRLPRVLEHVSDILGPNIAVWATSLFVKYPHDPAYVGWHQDGRFWGMLSDEVASAWIALTPSTSRNGCLRVVPGSHARGILPHSEGSENNILSRSQELVTDVDEGTVYDLELAPGDFSIHHVNLVHGSRPNPTDAKRVGFIIRYISPRVRQYNARPMVTVVKGDSNTFRHVSVVDPCDNSDMVSVIEEFEVTARDFLADVRASADALDRAQTQS
jgi:non-haem Fe2+, alpha-ketoglutarate-dependent halogenase